MMPTPALKGYSHSLVEFERHYWLIVGDVCRWKVQLMTQAAGFSRFRVYAKLKRFRIDLPKSNYGRRVLVD